MGQVHAALTEARSPPPLPPSSCEQRDSHRACNYAFNLDLPRKEKERERRREDTCRENEGYAPPEGDPYFLHVCVRARITHIRVSAYTRYIYNEELLLWEI